MKIALIKLTYLLLGRTDNILTLGFLAGESVRPVDRRPAGRPRVADVFNRTFRLALLTLTSPYSRVCRFRHVPSEPRTDQGSRPERRQEAGLASRRPVPAVRVSFDLQSPEKLLPGFRVPGTPGSVGDPERNAPLNVRRQATHLERHDGLSRTSCLCKRLYAMRTGP